MTKIRHAHLGDVEKLNEVESLCFPAAEEASRESLEKRVNAFPNHFWLLFDCDENGDWQMIFGVDTAPAFQHKGFASRVMERVIADTKRDGRKGIVLTCKEKLRTFYEKFGFKSEGVSNSTHGGVVWLQMRILF